MLGTKLASREDCLTSVSLVCAGSWDWTWCLSPSAGPLGDSPAKLLSPELVVPLSP
jgi:hypothetical protein